jgi:isohexenylglutaconyl-CoA hydratase
MIHATLDGAVWIVALARPERRNALTPDMASALLGAIDATPASARAILLRGEGAAFCSGFDLKVCLERPGTLEVLLRTLGEVVLALRVENPRPVVIAVQGAAIAGGCALLGGADVVVAESSAKFGYPVLPLGISPAVSAPFLRRCISSGRARARLLDPSLIDGAEAARIGLVHECVSTPVQVADRAREIAEMLAGKPPGAIAATRSWLAEIESFGNEPAQGLNASLSIVESQEQRDALARLFTKSNAMLVNERGGPR